jgi:hypothetical protein
MAQDWDIRPRAAACTACERPFEDGEACFSALFFGAEGYLRTDQCAACWDARGEERPPLSQWQSVHRDPPPAPEPALRKETAESLLRGLIEKEDAANTNAIYVLTVMLERKKVLVERATQTRDDGAFLRVYEHRKSGETFLVRDPRLSLDELEPVQQEVITLLGGGAEEEPAETESEPGAPAPPEPGAPPAPDRKLKDGFTSASAP